MAIDVLPDASALCLARRARALAAMEDQGIDVLLLGREANARYVSGAPRLWTAGTRPFGPGCVVVRATGAIHLVSTWDEGIPDDIPHEHLFGITWNPGNLLAWLRDIDGLSDARRVGTDSLTPRFAQLLPKLLPSAELVDAEPALEAARRVKTAAEIDAIRRSISVAEAGVAAAVAELRPGVSERHLTAAFMDAMARQGVTTPATQRVARIASPVAFGWSRSRPVGEEDLVVLDAGVVADGYIGEVGRTWPATPAGAGQAAIRLSRAADDLWRRLLAACRPGAPCSELLDAYEAAGLELPATPVAIGLGLGFDAPVVARDLRKTAEHDQLEPGMVLSVTARVADDRWSFLRKEAVLVTDGGAEVLTTSPHWPDETS